MICSIDFDLWSFGVVSYFFSQQESGVFENFENVFSTSATTITQVWNSVWILFLSSLDVKFDDDHNGIYGFFKTLSQTHSRCKTKVFSTSAEIENTFLKLTKKS